jgi:hypothetical protein
MPSVNVEPPSNNAMPDSNDQRNHNEDTNDNIIVNDSPAHSASVSYLNISFQEIINLLAHNESPTLLNTIRTAIRNSSIIVFILILFTMVALILETISLYETLQ